MLLCIILVINNIKKIQKLLSIGFPRLFKKHFLEVPCADSATHPNFVYLNADA
jgi:hypothetical protein